MSKQAKPQPITATLLQACELAGIRAPVSLSETITAFRILKDYGIHHNLEGEPVYETLMREEGKR